MPAKKALQKSRESLVRKARKCTDLAKAQRNLADAQHLVAHKLEEMSAKLLVDAESVQDELNAAEKKLSMQL